MKIPKYTISRGFNSEYQLWILLRLDIAALPLKVSRKEQCSVIRFGGQKDLAQNAIQSDMHPLYGDKYSTRPAIKCLV